MGWLDLLAVVLGTRDKGCYAAKELLGGGSRGQWWGGLVAIKKLNAGDTMELGPPGRSTEGTVYSNRPPPARAR